MARSSPFDLIWFLTKRTTSATVIARWLGSDPAAVLGASFAPLAFV